jgi:hypothetical protein
MAAEWHRKKCRFQKRGAEDVVPCALETWEFRLVLAFDTSCAHCEYHSLLPVALYS